MALVGLISTVVALAASSDFLTNYGTFLTVLLYFLVPWSAINLVDFYLVRKEHYSVEAIFDRDGIYGHWQWRGLLAYAIGFAAMIPFFSTPWFTGPASKGMNGVDISFFVGLAASALAYGLLARTLNLAEELAGGPRQPERSTSSLEPVAAGLEPV